MTMEVNKEARIEGLLKDHPEGLTIEDISQKAEISRNTTVKVLAKFEGQRKIRIRIVGQAKLHYWKFKK